MANNSNTVEVNVIVTQVLAQAEAEDFQWDGPGPMYVDNIPLVEPPLADAGSPNARGESPVSPQQDTNMTPAVAPTPLHMPAIVAHSAGTETPLATNHQATQPAPTAPTQGNRHPGLKPRRLFSS